MVTAVSALPPPGPQRASIPPPGPQRASIPPPGPQRASIPPPGPHGGDGARVAAALGIPPDSVLDLSASLNPVAPPIAPILSKYLDVMVRYPDPAQATLALAAAIGVDASRLVLTNGGAEAIALVASELGAGWVDEPDFSLYRRHLAVLDPMAPRFASNPHNPTGRLVPADSRPTAAPVTSSTPWGCAGVWDEAFFPMATGTWTRGDAERGCYVAGSLTKLFACPGLRAGYLLAPNEAAAERIRSRQPHWAVNGLVCAALPEMLDGLDLAATASAIARLRVELDSLLRGHGFDSQPSDANYLLVPDAAGLRDVLASRGVVVRDCTSFGLPDVIRVAVPDEAGLDRLDRALRVVE